MEKEMSSNLAEKYKFPQTDPVIPNMYQDKRGPNEKFRDIVSIINQKIPEDLAIIWSQVCNRNVKHPCYYRSGLSYLASDLKKLSKDFKYEKEIQIDPSKTMPETLKNMKGHSKYCKPSKESCSYLNEFVENSEIRSRDDIKQFLLEIANDKEKISYVLSDKSFCSKLINILLLNRCKLNMKQKTRLLLCKKLLAKGRKIKSKFKQNLIHISHLALQGEETKTVCISDLSKTNLPFARGLLVPNNISGKIKDKIINYFLCDSGSDCSILPYNYFREAGFKESQLVPCGIINLKGSTGIEKDCFLGKINLEILLQAKNGKFFRKKANFFVAKPSLGLQNFILGNDFMKKYQSQILFSNNSIEVKIFDENLKDFFELSLLQGNTINVTNWEKINKGDMQGSFFISAASLSQLNFNTFHCKNLHFPILDFSSFNTVSCISNDKIIRNVDEKDIIITIPFLSPATEEIEAKEANVKVQNSIFVSGEMQDSLFSPDMQDSLFTSAMQDSTDTQVMQDELLTQAKPVPNSINSHSTQPEYLNNDKVTLSNDTGKQYSSLPTSLPPCQPACLPAHQPASLPACQHAHTMSAECGTQPDEQACELLAQNYNKAGKIQTNWDRKYFQKHSKDFLDKHENSDMCTAIEEKYSLLNIIEHGGLDNSLSGQYSDCLTLNEQLLYSHHSEHRTESQKLPQKSFSEQVDKFTVGRIALDTGENIAEEQTWNHLNKKDRMEINNIVNKYKNFWAKDKFAIGNFKGFKVRITTEQGSSAYQKERRLNLSHLEAVKETIEGLKKSGVFSLSDSGQNDFICNLNIVPKPNTTTEMRYGSKADKYLQKVKKSGNQVNPTTGWRAAFDFTTLNKCLTDTGKLSLPTLSEVQQKTAGCLCSTIDLKNQFYSLRLEEDSKKYTNFYWQNTVLFHERMPMGISSTPYWAQTAMDWTFRDEVLERFQKENKVKLPFKSYRQFCLWYLDDCLLFSPINQSKETNLSPKKLHSILLQATLFALSEAGWLGSLNKCQLMTTNFSFLGTEMNSAEAYSFIQEDRIRNILSWRQPKSCAEVGSRLAVIGYFSKFAPYLRLLGLPLYKMIKENKFRWTKTESESWENIKFLMSLRVKIYHFNKNLTNIVTSDSSHVSMNASIFQLTDDGQLQLLDTQTKLYSAAELKQSPVQKESLAFCFALHKFEPYIRASCKETISLCDASSLQFIQRNKLYHSKQFNEAIWLSSLPNLSVCFTSGKSLLLSDILSRQYQEIFLQHNLTLSKEMCSLIPPLNQYNIPELTKLGPEALTDFLLSNPEPETIDVWPKRYHYKQDVRKTQLHNMDQNLSNETQLILALTLGFNSTAVLSLPVWRDILKSKSGTLSKTQQGDILKQNNLGKIHKKLQSLGLEKRKLQEILEKYHFPDPEQPPALESNISNSFWSESSESHCTCLECSQLLNKATFSTSAVELISNESHKIQNFIDACLPLIKSIYPSELKNIYNKHSLIKCSYAKRLNNVFIFEFMLYALHQSKFALIGDSQGISEKQVTFLNYYLDSKFYVEISKDNKIQILNSEQIKFSPLDILSLKLEFLFAFKGNVGNISCDLENFALLDTIISDGQIHEIKIANLFNLKDETALIPSGSIILSINLNLVSDGIVLLPTSRNILRDKQLIMQDNSVSDTLDKLAKVLSSKASFYINSDYSKTKFGMAREEKQMHISQLAKVCDVEKCAFPKSKSGIINCHFSKYQAQLGQLILGQKFMKNKNLFSKEAIIQLQNEDDHLREIIEILKTKQSDIRYNKFVLHNGILYKTKPCLGKLMNKLCLPSHVSEEILFRMHSVYGLHFSTSQTAKIFSLNFYCHKMDELITKVHNNCQVCVICKPNYKRNVVGDMRTFENNLTPGEVIVADLCFLPRDKFGFSNCILFVDRLTGYCTATPLKSTESIETSKALQQFLQHIPAPKILQVDGGGEFDRHFSAICAQNNIMLRTKIPKRSQANATAEVACRDFKVLLTKLANEKPEGRNAWSSLVPILLNAFNSRHPHGVQMSRKNLFFSPFYNNILNIIFSPSENLDNIFNQELMNVQKKSHLELNTLRKKALKNLRSRFHNPGFKLKVGQILTESSSKSSKETVDGSRALLPTCERLYKVLEVKEGNMGAICRNLHSGKVMTICISDLRPLAIPDLLHLSIDPNKAFQGHLDSRARNLWGKGVIENETQSGPDEGRQTRSGKCFSSELKPQKSILRVTGQVELQDYHLLDTAQLSACKAGLKTAKQLGKVLTPDQEILETFRPSKSLTLSKVENGINKNKSKTKISFNKEVSGYIGDEKRKFVLNTEGKIEKLRLNFSYYLTNLDISLKETQILSI